MSAATPTLSLRPPSLLRKVLWLDAVSSAGMTLILLLFAGALSPLLGVEASLLRTVGAIFVPFVALVAWAASREHTPRVAVGWVIALNESWVIACVGALWLGLLEPTMLGTIFIVSQAVFVGAMAVFQFIGLKREGVYSA